MALEKELNIKSVDGSRTTHGETSQSSAEHEKDNGMSSLETARDIVLEMEKNHAEQTSHYSDELKNMSKTLTKLRKENEDLIAQCKELQAENDELSMALDDSESVDSDMA